MDSLRRHIAEQWRRLRSLGLMLAFMAVAALAFVFGAGVPAVNGVALLAAPAQVHAGWHTMAHHGVTPDGPCPGGGGPCP